MSDDRARELISAAADGALTPAEQAELEQLLGASAEARHFRDDLEQMESIIAGIPAEEPPAALRKRILSQIPAPAQPPAAAVPQWIRSLFDAAVVRYGLAAAAGVLLAVSVYESQPPFSRTPDVTELVGTMLPGHTIGRYELLGRHRFHADGAESRVRLERRDSALLLDIQVDATRPVTIAVDFSASGMQLNALAQMNGPIESIELTNDILRLRVRGQRTLTALLHDTGGRPARDTQKIRFQFSSNDELQTKEMLVPAM